jgi:hypothetical protein
VYHHLKRINCQPLDKLNQLARVTLAFGLERELHDAKQQVRVTFIQYCKDEGFPEAGKFLWRKNTISKPLFDLVQIPVNQKQAILPAYDADTNLDAAFQQGQFAYFSIPANNKPALKHVEKIMKSFYTHVLASPTGVEANALNETENLTRQTVLQTFIVEQQGISMMVCPGCDGSPPEQESDGTIREDVDHFFPKSRYPFLTIHPLNLTPYCKHCNQDYKKAKDPLRTKNGVPTISLGDIFHPYIHSVHDEYKKSEVQVSIQRDKRTEAHIKILPSSNDSHDVSRHRSLNHLLSLQIRWDGALQANQTTKSIKQLLVVLVGNEPSRPFTPDMDWLLEKLPNIERTIENGIGEHERNIAAHAYVKWMRTDTATQAEWLEKLQLYTQ